MAGIKVDNVGSNMTQVSLPDGTEVLYSYKEPVAAFVPGEGFLRTSKRWSNTTTRHITKWLGIFGYPTVKDVDQGVINTLVETF